MGSSTIFSDLCMTSSFHKRAIPCEICGQNFFPSSLPFHKKQCAVKQRFVEVPCPFCDLPIQNYLLNEHIARECKKPSRKQLVQPMISDGRFPCSVCGRRFAGGDRLVKHQKICRRNSISRSASSLTLSSSRTTPSPPLTEKTWTWSSDWRQRRDDMKQQIKSARSQNEPSVEFVLVTKNEENRNVEEIANDSIDSLEGCFLYEQDSLEIEAAPLDNMSPDSLEEYPQENLFLNPPDKREPTAWTVEWDPPRTRKKTPPTIKQRKEEIKFNDENFQRTAPKLLLNTLATRGGVTVFSTNRHNSSLRFN